jgi:hypothetical protein
VAADLLFYFVLTNPFKKTALGGLVGGNRKGWDIPYE